MIGNVARSENLRSETAGSEPLDNRSTVAVLLDRDGNKSQDRSRLHAKHRDDELALRRRVENFLASRSVPGLRRLTVNVDGSSVVLTGLVRTYYEKQLAINCCQRVAGVLSVVDSIEVRQEAPAERS